MVKLEKIKLIDISPAEYNPRKISDADKLKLRNSIDTFGVVDPIIINLKNNKIIGGHQRYEALLDKFMEDNSFFEELNLIKLGDIGWAFPDTDLSIENEDYEKALNLALNKISGEWDNTKLEELFEDLKLSELDIELTGFDGFELEDLNLDNFEDNTEIVEDEYELPDDDEIETDIKQGDMFKLGPHCLLCGDSTKQEDIEKLMNNELAGIVFTDPPYDLSDTEYVENIFRNTEKNAEIFIMHNERELAKIITKYDEYFRRLFAVDFKVAHLINSQAPMTQVDYIAHFRKESPTKFNNLNDHFTTLIESAKTSKKNNDNFNHKQAKKVDLPSTFIQHFSKKDEIVLDLFGGSGSTLIAAEQTNRRARIIEFDEKYCQIILDRWEEFTGEKVEKI